MDHCHASQTPIHIFARRIRHKTGQKRDWLPAGNPVVKGNEYHLIAAADTPVPGTMLGDECTASVGIWELCALIKRDLEWGHMRAEKEIWDQSPSYKIWPRRYAIVHVIAQIGVGISVEPAICDVCEIVKWNVFAEIVALVYGCPQTR